MYDFKYLGYLSWVHLVLMNYKLSGYKYVINRLVAAVFILNLNNYKLNNLEWITFDNKHQGNLIIGSII
jgi:hypothetical protein